MPEKKFGKKIKALRQQRKLSLRQVAKLLVITPAYLSRIENGHEHPPSAAIIGAIARILEVDESELFGLVPKDLLHQRIPEEIIEGYQKDEITTRKIPEFFRTVRDSELTEDQWDEIIKSIKRKKKE